MGFSNWGKKEKHNLAYVLLSYLSKEKKECTYPLFWANAKTILDFGRPSKIGTQVFH